MQKNKPQLLLITCFLLGLSIIPTFFSPLYCQGGEQPIGTIERTDPRLNSIIGKNAKVVIIAEGLEWSEGPLWIKDKKMLLFSDIPRNCIYKWTKKGGKEIYLTRSGYTGLKPHFREPGSNALLLNSRGQLVLCQHGDRRIAIMNASIDDPRSDFITVVDNYHGKKFDSPNDAVFNSNGDLYFTDPPYGLENLADDTSKAAPYQGVYKVSPAGEITLLTDSITRPNGIAFLPGDKTIIVANSDPLKPVWYAFDLDEKGLFVNGRVFYNATDVAKKANGLPDGLKVDKRGNVFATGPGGVWVFDKSGKLLGKILINGVASNCAFGDDDKTLYITADMYVLKVKLR